MRQKQKADEAAQNTAVQHVLDQLVLSIAADKLPRL